MPESRSEQYRRVAKRPAETEVEELEKEMKDSLALYWLYILKAGIVLWGQVFLKSRMVVSEVASNEFCLTFGLRPRAAVRKLRSFSWFLQLTEEDWRLPMWTCLFSQVLTRVGEREAMEWLSSVPAATCEPKLR